MEKYIEVMKQSLDLSGTILEGLQHIQNLLGEVKIDETMALFEDVISAFAVVERSIEPVKEELHDHDLEEKVKSVKGALEHVVSAYEVKNYGKVQEVMQFTFVPQFKKLKDELERAFRPYLIS